LALYQRRDKTLKSETVLLATMQARAKKRKISATIDTNLIEWLDQQTKNYTFQSRSDGLEKGVLALKKEIDKQKT
jgi:hypothetical protein